MITREKFRFILDEFIRDLSSLGSLPVHILLNLIILVLNFNLGLKVFISLFLSSIISYAIRLVYYKERPEVRNYQTLLERIDAASFPSIHVFRSFSLVVILSVFFSNIIVSIVLGFSAVLIGFSRIFLKQHHLSDVLVGGILGIILGFVIGVF